MPIAIAVNKLVFPEVKLLKINPLGYYLVNRFHFPLAIEHSIDLKTRLQFLLNNIDAISKNNFAFLCIN